MAGSVGQYTIGWAPWMGITAQSPAGKFNGVNDATALGMGVLTNNGGAGDAQNDEFSADFWLDAGTWKVVMIGRADTNKGISTVQFNGVSQGTLDWYAASIAENTYQEITGISVTTAGIKTVKILMATKNASSSGYSLRVASIAFIRTAGTSSTPGGSDTPGYTWIYLPWMGAKSTTGFTRSQGSTLLGGGKWESTGAQNDETAVDVWLDTGTYKIAVVHNENTSHGIETHSLDGTTVGTIDEYNAGGAQVNQYDEITGIAIATAGVYEYKIKAATKNAGSSNYYLSLDSLAWIRTGA